MCAISISHSGISIFTLPFHFAALNTANFLTVGLIKDHIIILCLRVWVNLPLQWSGLWSRSRRGGLGWWPRPDWSAGSSCSCRHIQTGSTWGSALRGTTRRTILCKVRQDRVFMVMNNNKNMKEIENKVNEGRKKTVAHQLLLPTFQIKIHWFALMIYSGNYYRAKPP